MSLIAARTGQDIVVNDAVKNQSMADVGPFTILFYLSKDSVFDATDTAICKRAVNSLKAGALDPSGGPARTVCQASGVPAGSYYVIVVVDSERAVQESNETNNTRATAASLTVP